MVHVEQEVTPRVEHEMVYGERYARFCEECRERGYLA
jgi:hypothetical protein